MQVKLKEGVSLRGAQPQVFFIIERAKETRKEVEIFKNLIVTSVTDGKHGKGSLHYIGHAVDFRISDIASTSVARWSMLLQDTLGPEFDVVIEKTHLHVEFQPK